MSSARQYYESQFAKAYAQLNAAQREAVEQTEGPVLVVAGPGTGKTHMLAARIGRILQETDTRAANILCLTFTDAAVHAMRQRLLQWIGPEAHHLHIYTYHAFANKVIQENLHYFGFSELRPVTALEQVAIIRELLEEQPAQHPLRKGKHDLYFFSPHLQHLFALMQRENWTIDFCRQAIQDYLESLPERPDFLYQRRHGPHQKGDLKPALVAKAQLQMERLSAGVELFAAYQAKKRQMRVYDFADMIRWVLDAFQEYPNLLRRYQEQYLYVLVDEYQDTNGAQNALLRQLINYWEAPNVFVVGDDDQSVFEFQGARLKNLLDFAEQFSAQLKTVVLNTNYRSGQNLLDAAGQLIAHNELRLVAQLQLEKQLIAGRAAAQNPLPQCWEIPTVDEEVFHIADALEAWHKAGRSWEEMAVLYARHRQVVPLMRILDQRGIPYQTRRRINLLDEPLITQLRQLLRYLTDRLEQRLPDERQLFQLLHLPFWGASSRDLARLAIYQRNARDAEHQLSWQELLWSPPPTIVLDDPDALQRTATYLDTLTRLAATHSPLMVLEQLINRSGILPWLSDHPDRIHIIQLLRSLLHFTEREQQRQPRMSLADLLATLDQMDKHRIRLPMEHGLGAAAGVTLSTAHSAKGLEFDGVVVMGCTENEWEKAGANTGQFTFPDTLTSSGETDALEGRRRLFYVAITRARADLICTYAQRKADGKSLSPSRFIVELETSGKLTTAARAYTAEVVESLAFNNLFQSEQPAVQPFSPTAIDAILEGYRLSASGLDTFLRCPLAFYYEQVLGVPTLMREGAAYGQAAHNALQRLFDAREGGDQPAFPVARILVQFFEQEMERLRPYFSATAYEQFLEMGRSDLTAFYEQRLPDWPRYTRAEWSVQRVEVAGVPLTGKIDRLDFIDDQLAYIVDYKSGKYDPKRLRPPTEKEPHGGSYRRQLLFYALLYQQSGAFPYRLAGGYISYLKPNRDGAYDLKPLKYRQADLDWLKDLLQTTFAKINAHDFYTGCGEPDCSWCQLASIQGQHQPMGHERIEELDDD